MSFQMVQFLVGAAAIVLAVLGGNIRAKEVDVGPIDLPGRVLIGIFGLAVILIPLNGWSPIMAAARAVWPKTNTAPLPTPSPSQSLTPSPSQLPTPAPASSTAPPAPSPVPSETTPPPTPKPTRTAQQPVTPTPVVDEAASFDSLFTEDAEQVDPSERTITLEDSLAETQVYENIRVLINDIEQVSFAIDGNRKLQKFKVKVKGGDRYSIIGTVGWIEKNANGEGTYLANRKARGTGTFSSNPESKDYFINVKERGDETTRYEIKLRE